jgi:cytoskeletal protein RodZ
MMYNFRTFSFVLFTGMFWAVEMSVAAAVWIYLVMFTPKDEDEDVPKEESTDVKTEDDPGRPVKEEEADIESGTEADVEDTEGPITAVRAHGRLDPDSGVGTSAEGASAVSVRRRPSVKQEEG